MPFPGAGHLVGADRPAGVVDHRMARHALVEEYRRGRLAQHEVCDAHPELRRAAENLGRETREVCPICEDRFLVLVTYAFGAHLPKSGYVVEDRADMNKVRRMTPECTCYVVEACTGCGWNHLLQTFPVEGLRGR
ncbi:MAG: DUF5318 family protein [Acidimicrobiia bacterium]